MRFTVHVCVHLCLYRAGSLLGLLCQRPRRPRLTCCPLLMTLLPRPHLALPARPLAALALAQPQVREVVGSRLGLRSHRAQCSGSGRGHASHTARRARLAPMHVHASIRLHVALAAQTAQTAMWVCAALGPSVSVLVCGVCLGAGQHLGVSYAIVCGSFSVSWSAHVWCGI